MGYTLNPEPFTIKPPLACVQTLISAKIAEFRAREVYPLKSNLEPCTINPKPSTLNPQPSTLNLKP